MLYFGYCTLLDESEMRRLCPGAAPLEVGRITGYRLCFSRFQGAPDQGSCDVVVAPGHEMWGLLWEMVPAEYDELDRLAGVDRGHLARIDVEVTGRSGKRHAATTYSNPTPAGAFQPSADYVRPVLAGARALQLPPAYLEEVEGIVAAALG